MNVGHFNSDKDKFVVLFIPEPQQGVPVQVLKENIKFVFKMQDSEVSRLFRGKPTVIKTGADEDTAIMYKRAIERCGGSCWMEPEQHDAQSNIMTA
ncbi:MAG: hypothetical protein HKN88_09250 [Gammaproteobacteria bacterium]|nr:hypothetical protein [Gammaproteobacteria bacterium]NNC98241.1 hypothetical protein [Gammaproteobacteria bacterium]NNM14320.1 hypothetical protein [Gammaproteobacteria bacterium]